MFPRIVLLIIVVIPFSGHFAFAQNPRNLSSAARHYKEGTRKLEKGDLDSAIQDFTEAIELSSRLDGTKASAANPAANASRFDFYDSAASRITVIDPLTANAYISRGLARQRKVISTEPWRTGSVP